ncbi:MAG: hypothetical protein J5794_07830 [Lachnospiraceae bacterium]|nr:hypothetical protein [Lachnospiraceae bacterium]
MPTKKSDDTVFLNPGDLAPKKTEVDVEKEANKVVKELKKDSSLMESVTKGNGLSVIQNLLPAIKDSGVLNNILQAVLSKLDLSSLLSGLTGLFSGSKDEEEEEEEEKKEEKPKTSSNKKKTSSNKKKTSSTSNKKTSSTSNKKTSSTSGKKTSSTSNKKTSSTSSKKKTSSSAKKDEKKDDTAGSILSGIASLLGGK